NAEPASIEHHSLVRETDQNALIVLHQETSLSKQRIKLAMTHGAVWLTRGKNTQRLRRAKRVLRVGDELHLYYNEKILNEEPIAPKLIADCGGYSVWDKPYGLRSQGSKWGDHCTVVRWAERALDRSSYTVHCLDRAANGLILIAHTKTIAASLSALFRERKIEKRYQALVEGNFGEEQIPHRCEFEIDGKAAVSVITHDKFLNKTKQSLLRITIETGRKHQIRRHLAELGYPVVGDRLYGNASPSGPDLCLSARSLSFHCPIEDRQVLYELHRD
ncbi:MAG: RNA pseudouridine synthase, partial [Pseudomonadota bacterium]